MTLDLSCEDDLSPLTISATDLCSAVGDIVYDVDDSRVDGSCPHSYVLTRTYSATDECGNTAYVTQTINVEDTTPPSITTTIPLTLDLSCEDDLSPLTISATDLCSAVGDIVYDVDDSRVDGSCPHSYVLTRTYSATDECGNTAYVTQTINVEDTIDLGFKL